MIGVLDYTEDALAWAVPRFSRSQVDSAGQILAYSGGAAFDQWVDDEWEQYERALEVINNWRSSHSYPLQVIKMALLGRAQRIDEDALVAQRLKRLASIGIKLRHQPHMKLSQMQDIGGCRAVLSNATKLGQLVKLYDWTVAKNPKADRPQFVEKYDYINSPKPDGYRGVHYVYKYATSSEHRSVYNKLRIEVQLRSQLQHAWATAVESVSIFTGQALKSSMGTAQWRRFFSLAGSAIALRERRPLVPGTPTDRREIAKELQHLSTELNAVHILQSSGDVLQFTAGDTNAVAYLLVLDAVTQQIHVTGYARDETARASEEYLEAEKRIRSKGASQQAVLVSVESLEALRRAYPNYYLDTSSFVTALQTAMKP